MMLLSFLLLLITKNLNVLSLDYTSKPPKSQYYKTKYLSFGGRSGNRTRASWFCRPQCFHFTIRPIGIYFTILVQSAHMIKKISLILLSSIFLSACTIPFLGSKAGVQITSNPQGMVTINSESSGQTPVYQENLKAGSYAVKISPLDTTLQPWEGRVTLTAGTLTVVDRQLAVTPDQAHGHTLYFEKIDPKDKLEVNITSLPNTVSVLIDGSPAGFTPFSSSSITEGGHTFTLTAPGFQDKVIKASVEPGFRLNINVQLAGQKIEEIPTPTPTATPSATPTPTKADSPTNITPLPSQSTSSAIPKPYVEINSASLGWLRVRQEPSATATEIAKINHGDKFPHLKTQTGWYQIEYQENKNGWISSSYATLVVE